MERDAFTAGVEPGGLNSTNEIKILCCYLISEMQRPVPHDLLVEALTVSGLVNYFEVASAISELLFHGNLIQEEAGYIVSDSGKQISDTLSRDLPLSVKEKSISELKDLMSYFSKSEQIDVQILDYEYGFKVVCVLNDDVIGEIFSTTLYVPDRETAVTDRKHFIDNSEKLYRNTLYSLTGKTLD